MSDDLSGDTSAAVSPAAIDLLVAIERIESALEEEARLLESGSLVDLKQVTDRKTRFLLDLNKAVRMLTPGHATTVRDRIETLRTKLEENERLLQAHLGAAREIAAIVIKVIADHDSDGTYSSRAGVQAS